MTRPKNVFPALWEENNTDRVYPYLQLWRLMNAPKDYIMAYSLAQASEELMRWCPTATIFADAGPASDGNSKSWPSRTLNYGSALSMGDAKQAVERMNKETQATAPLPRQAKEYKTITAYAPEHLDLLVNQHLADGWDLHGYQYSNSVADTAQYFQPVTRHTMPRRD